MSVKTRSSCDGCHFAKVKCQRTPGGCVRCSAMRSYCQSSPALPRVYKKRASHQRSGSRSTDGMGTLTYGILSPSTSTNSESPHADIDTMNTREVSTSFAAQESSACTDAQTCDSILSSWEGSTLGPPQGGNLAPDASLLIESTGAQHTELSLDDICQTTEEPLLMLPYTLPASEKGAFQQSQLSQKRPVPAGPRCKHLPQLIARSQPLMALLNDVNPPADLVLQVGKATATQCRSALGCSCTAEHLGLWTMALGLLDTVSHLFASVLQGCSSSAQNNSLTQPANMDNRPLRLGRFELDRSAQRACIQSIVGKEISSVRETLLHFQANKIQYTGLQMVAQSLLDEYSSHT